MGDLVVRDLRGSANWEVFTFGVRERRSIWFLNLTLWIHLLNDPILLCLTLLCPPALPLHLCHLILSLSPHPFQFLLHLRKSPLSLFPPQPLLFSFTLPLPHQRRHLQLIEVLDHLQCLRVLLRTLRLDDLLEHVVQEFQVLLGRVFGGVRVLQFREDQWEGLQALGRLVVWVQGLQVVYLQVGLRWGVGGRVGATPLIDNLIFIILLKCVLIMTMQLLCLLLDIILWPLSYLLVCLSLISYCDLAFLRQPQVFLIHT